MRAGARPTGQASTGAFPMAFALARTPLWAPSFAAARASAWHIRQLAAEAWLGPAGRARSGSGAGSRPSLAVQPASSSSSTVMIVESPAKARKIQGFLGQGYRVMASLGHVCDLSQKEGSVKPEQDFALVWEVDAKKRQLLADMAAAVSGARQLLLATDPDREGEAISWHVVQELQARGVLKPDVQVGRITFTEITKPAITTAIAAPRQVSQALVDAYLARRALDYLVGYHLSPVLWRKLPGARSAGRVQSAALRLVADRESEIETFTPQEHWSVHGRFAIIADSSSHPGSGSSSDGGTASSVIQAQLVKVDGKALGKLAIGSKAAADALVARSAGCTYAVAEVKRKESARSPPPPFTTSTLQQAASRQLGFSAARTMQLAQGLYEEGLITYMRTDGVQMSTEAVEALRQAAGAAYGPQYVPPAPQVYISKAKNAQEAHEAIRPTDPSGMPPEAVAAKLGAAEADRALLYGLIWRRALACQMASALLQQVSADIASDDKRLVFRASGTALLFPGYRAAYDDGGEGDRGRRKGKKHGEGHEEEGDGEDEGGDDGEEGAAAGAGKGAVGGGSSEAIMAALSRLPKGAALAAQQVAGAQHFTRPPPRYNDASLVKALEDKGVGRPSTYASIIKLLQDRGYTSRQGRTLTPTPLGRVLNAFLQAYFGRVVDYGFTSAMEEQLDDISGGRAQWKGVMSLFWSQFTQWLAASAPVTRTAVFDMLDATLGPVFFRQAVLTPTAAEEEGSGLALPVAAASQASHAVAALGDAAAAALASDPRRCPLCGQGRLVLKPSKRGPFIGCMAFSKDAAAEASCSYARPLIPASQLLQAGSDSDAENELGVYPETGEAISIKVGPFGIYLQAVAPDGASRNVGLSPTLRAKAQAGSLTLEEACQLLVPPKVLGLHPEDGQPVLFKRGRYGPYVEHDGVFASIKGAAAEDADSIGLEEAVALLAARKAQGPSRGRSRAKVTVATRGGGGRAKTAAAAKAAGSSSDPGDAVLEAQGGKAAAGRRAKANAKAAARVVDSEVDDDDGRTGGKGKAAGAKKVQAGKGSAKEKAAKGGKAAAVDKAAAAAKPARAVSAYQTFLKARYKELAQTNPGASSAQVMSLVAAAWRETPVAEKEQYKQGPVADNVTTAVA